MGSWGWRGEWGEWGELDGGGGGVKFPMYSKKIEKSKIQNIFVRMLR